MNTPDAGQLSPHFHLREFAVSARFPHLVEPVPPEFVPNVRALVRDALEPWRVRIGRSIAIPSGYRGRALNDALPGSKTSQHRKAEAADCRTVDIEAAFIELMTMIREGEITGVGQVIYYPEDGFVHVALPSKRYPTPRVCIHSPSRGYRYRPFTPTSAALKQLLSGSTERVR